MKGEKMELGTAYIDPTDPHEFEKSSAPGHCNICFGKWSEKIHHVEIVAEDRPETEPCERGTVGCCIRHSWDSDCQPW